MKKIEGGITAAKGFQAAGGAAGSVEINAPMPGQVPVPELLLEPPGLLLLLVQELRRLLSLLR